MAIAKNKNIRKLVVNNIEYYWSIKYDDDYGIIQCDIGLVEKPNYRFGFSCGADKSHTRYIHNSIAKEDQLKAVTPKLIRQAIEYVNKNIIWKNSEATRIFYNAEGFSC